MLRYFVLFRHYNRYGRRSLSVAAFWTRYMTHLSLCPRIMVYSPSPSTRVSREHHSRTRKHLSDMCTCHLFVGIALASFRKRSLIMSKKRLPDFASFHELRMFTVAFLRRPSDVKRFSGLRRIQCRPCFLQSGYSSKHCLRIAWMYFEST